MFAKSVLITGANRGIGLELVKQLVDQTEHLFAGCRSPNQAEELKAIAEAHKHVIILQLDITQESNISSSIATIAEIVGDKGLNCLINNAAFMDTSLSTIENTTAEGLNHSYEVNTIAPAMLIKACLPLLRQASSQCPDKRMSVSRASILNMSTKVASITDNSSARNYGYRMSKIALNMLTKNLSIELKPDNILAVNLHPGWVKTDMGGPNALITTEQSIEGMLKVVSNFSEKNNGMFYGWNGEVIPW